MSKQGRFVVSLIAAAAALGVASAPASADTSASPSNLTFADQKAGTDSALQTVTVTTKCVDLGGGVCVPDFFSPAVAITGPNASSFTQTNDCTSMDPDGCTISVRFKPSAPGNYFADLTLGTGVVGNGPLPTSLFGSAFGAGSGKKCKPAKKSKKGKKKKCKRKKK